MKSIQRILISAGVLAGCVKEQTTLPPPRVAPNPPPKVAVDPSARVQTLARLADRFAATSNQLPGSDMAQHRQLMANALAQLEEILPILRGPNPGAEFSQQLQVIRDAQAELATGPQDLSPEPTIDSALRATRDALASLAQDGYYDQASLTPIFDRLSARMNDLDTVRGPLHQVEAGEAVGMISQIISKMADVMGQRTAEQNASSQPAANTAPANTPPASK